MMGLYDKKYKSEIDGNPSLWSRTH